MTANLQQASTDDRSHRRGDRAADTPAPPTDDGIAPSSEAVPCDELLALLGDDYACDIVRALAAGPMTARAITERFEMSRPTVYRRLERLRDAGIIDAELRPDRDGHHRQRFHLVIDEFELRIREDGIHGTVRCDEPAAD